MPGVAMHILMADLAADTLVEPGDAPAQAIINSNKEVYHLGAAGPDLALLAPDFGDGAVEFIRALADWHDQYIEPIIQFQEKYIEPISKAIDAITEPVAEAIDDATCGLIGDFAAELDLVSQRIGAILQAGLGSIVVSYINIFDKMTPPIQKGKTIEDWFWFDTLHNRRTGDFLDQMWSRAQTDAQKAYVLGYASHYAGDLIGHQFVNTVVGSPARARLQRHHFAENMIDTHVFDVVRDVDVSGAKVHLQLPHGDDVEAEPSLRVLVDRLNDVPDDMREIFELISESMEATFKDVAHPKRISSEYLTVEHLNVAFWFLLAAMRASTASFIAPPKPLSDEALQEAMDAVADFLQTATNPPSPSISVPDMCAAFWSDSCDFSLQAIQDWADALADALGYLLEVLAWAGRLIRDLWLAMACTLTAPIKAGLQSALYIVHSALHEAVERLREVMVQAAAIYPTRAWVRANPLAQSFLTVDQKQIVAALERQYPHRAAKTNAGFQSYPTTGIEEPPSFPSSFVGGTRVEQIVADFPVAQPSLQDLAQAPSPADSNTLAEQWHQTPIGSVVPFTAMLQRQLWAGAGGQIADFSMDADRGWLHLNWLITPGAEKSVMWDSGDPVAYDWDR